MSATSTRRRAPARGRTSRRQPSKSARSAKSARKSDARTRGGDEPGVLARGRQAAGRQLAGHRHDVLAIALFVVGAIFVLGLWTDLAGPVG
jgi:hypothetical protein